MSNEKQDYNITEHIHRFAVWTAARAVQRNFTTTANIKAVIEKTQLRKLIENPEIAHDDFNKFHDACAKKIIRSFEKIKDKNGNQLVATYGIAAKIIAIYIKTAVIIPNKGKKELSKVAHPPIDRILLSNLKKEYKEIDNISWTKFDRDQYLETMRIINNIKAQKKYFAYWEIEVNWTASEDEKS
ncbi:MAG: hypothetical protein FGM54_05240 [Chitinophagaceae bacterium]|nr:hypothetical protein [Chitinophagaceae bacterium]